MDPIITVGNIVERDIDFVLLSEFCSASEFGNWVLQRCGYKPVSARVLSAHRSKTDSVGESDLEVSFRIDDQVTVRLLIENKIDAEMQPRQAERYRERGLEDVEREECDEFRTVLIAPQEYRENVGLGAFDCYVAYEDVLKWFETQAPYDSSAKTKLRLMSLALDRSRDGWQLIEDTVITKFWFQYAQLCGDVDKALVPPESAKRPAGSSFVYFRQPQLPRTVSLCHKIEHGFVDLQFAGRGRDCAQLQQLLADWLTPQMQVVRAGKSAAVRVAIRPRVRMQDEFGASERTIRECIETASAMLKWFEALPLTVRAGLEAFE